jgi:hypothetical protein
MDQKVFRTPNKKPPYFHKAASVDGTGQISNFLEDFNID